MWISIALAKVNRTEIGSQEWMGVVFLQYCIEPSDLTRHIQILHLHMHSNAKREALSHIFKTTYVTGLAN